MGQITLRGIDPRIERQIRSMARKTGKSLNRVVVDMIYEYTGFTKNAKKHPADSLKKLAGGWSDRDAAKFVESIGLCEQIDEEMWR